MYLTVKNKLFEECPKNIKIIYFVKNLNFGEALLLTSKYKSCRISRKKYDAGRNINKTQNVFARKFKLKNSNRIQTLLIFSIKIIIKW